MLKCPGLGGRTIEVWEWPDTILTYDEPPLRTIEEWRAGMTTPTWPDPSKALWACDVLQPEVLPRGALVRYREDYR